MASEAKDVSAFCETWKQTTTLIHQRVKCARESFLIKEQANSGHILSIARWDSLEDWQAFWKAENPEEMLAMLELGERVSVKV